MKVKEYLFIGMNYLKHYNLLIETRKKLNRQKSKGDFLEKHHIIPKSMGGTDEDSNLVLLTGREHFLAHWLLWRHYRDRKTAAMFNAMNRTGRGQKRITSSRGYEEAKKAGSFAQKGRKLSEEVRAKIKKNNARTGKPNWNSGKTFIKRKVKCSRCGDFTSVDLNKRWHEKNCKEADILELLKTFTRKQIQIKTGMSNQVLQYWITKIKKKYGEDIS